MALKKMTRKRLYAALTRGSSLRDGDRDRIAREFGYIHDPDLSTENTAVYAKPDKSHAVVSFAGTNIRNKSDLGADANLVVGNLKNTERYRNSAKIASAARNKYGNNVTLSGYSLGGAVADTLGGEEGYESVVYNPGSNPLWPTRRSERTTVYRHRDDVVSQGYKFKPGYLLNPRRLLEALTVTATTGAHDLNEDEMEEVTD